MQAREYVEQVMRYVEADESIKRRLSEDLYSHIQAEGGAAAIARMGDPKEMAAELMDAIYSDKSEVIRELVRTKAALRNSGGYEYISKRKLFGLPLVHIRYKRASPLKPAKGIVAIGNTAVGIVAVGGAAVGLVSIGGISVGLLSLAGVAVGLLAAFGGVSVGALAYGGVAVGVYAFGGAAIASRVAIGGWAMGTAAIGGTAEGAYTIATGGTSLDFSAVSKQEARALIEQAYPNIWPPIVRFLTGLFR